MPIRFYDRYIHLPQYDINVPIAAPFLLNITDSPTDLLFAQIQTMTSMTGTSFDMRHPWKVDNRIRNILEGSRTFTFGRDNKLKLYLGLQDVFAISGFPVDGSRSIICEDIDTKQICIDMLGTYEQEPTFKMKVSKRWLKDTFEAVPKENIRQMPSCTLCARTCYVAYCLASVGRKNVKGPMWIVEDVNLIPYVDYQGYLHKRIFFSRVVLFNFDQIIYHEPDKGFLQLDIINLQWVRKLDVLLPKSSKGCQTRKLMDHYLPYIELWKNRHLEMNCIKDDRPCFLLPSVPAENDSDGPQSDQQNDLDGPQSDQQNDTEDFYDSEGQQTAENDSDRPQPNQQDDLEDQETSPFSNDDHMGSINDAHLNPEIRNYAGSSMSPKLKKRVIKNLDHGNGMTLAQPPPPPPRRPPPPPPPTTVVLDGGGGKGQTTGVVVVGDSGGWRRWWWAILSTVDAENINAR
ncbi:hypothetical protein Tco_0826040 [Tanacetum coccineum]